MAKAKTAKKTSNSKPAKSNTKTMILLILGSIGSIAIFKTGFIFLMIALLPSIVAYYLDRTSSKTRYHTVLACNLSGVIPYMAEILRNNGTQGGYVTELMSDPFTWLVVYASAGFGWLLLFATPIFAQFIISMFNSGQMARYQSIQDRMVKDWGKEVADILRNPKEN